VVKRQTTVQEVIRRKGVTELRCADVTLILRPFVYVREGDRLEYEGSPDEPEYVWRIVERGKRVSMEPAFQSVHEVAVGRWRLNVEIRERSSVHDWKRAKRLEKYHYRGAPLKFIPGRKTVLVAEVTKGPLEWMNQIVGYAIIAQALPAVSVRLKLLKQDFSEHVKSGTINRFVRVPRVVVAPEARSIGIGRLLAEACVRYADERWDVRGMKPWGVEVVAAMTEYHPFFEKAGFVRLGNTGASPSPIRPAYGSSSDWGPRPESDKYRFRAFPNAKPYLLFPLDSRLKAQVNGQKSVQPEEETPESGTKTLSVRARGLVCAVTRKTRRTKRVQVIRDTFGLDDEGELVFELTSATEIEVWQGDVVLISGPSGSGKTSLARYLANLPGGRGVSFSGRVTRGSRPRSVELETELRARALIDQFDLPLDRSIALLNSVGLSEARLYQVTPEQLSVGQRHRLRVAHLIASSADCWVADDLGSGLDDLSAAIAASALSAGARRVGSTLLVTSATPDRILASVRPDIHVRIGIGGDVVVERSR
jgi:ABC-type ATPase with predicted acetyltransferase domain